MLSTIVRNARWPLSVALLTAILWAEQGVLVLHVKDPQGKPLAGVQLATEGDGSTSPLTDRAGKTRVRLAPQTPAGAWVTLQVVRAPADLVFISPWNQRAIVPRFENETDNYVPLILAHRGDRTMLESGAALIAMAASINKEISPKTPEAPSPEDQKRRALEQVARSFGLPVEDIDKAIRAWGQKTDDVYERGLVALYQGKRISRGEPPTGSISPVPGSKSSERSCGHRERSLFSWGFDIEQGRYKRAPWPMSELWISDRTIR